MKNVLPILFLTITHLSFINQNSNLLHGKGEVTFVSSATLETIKAYSNKLKGIIDISNNSFAFTFPVNTFEGFNSPLQKEHFKEHYLETEKFPNSTFTGKILGFKICDHECNYEVIAKGKLTIHGITKVVTIPATISKSNKDYVITSNFKIKLSDYDIEIPLILEGKISPLVAVTVIVKFNESNE